ncbi:hypothetical protein B0H13DRAFT_1896603 [Mycena leptocephala]|nr:hypothetical protein B0H13DRAFT_1896603 [Mycena leptocephala]
MGAIPRIGIVTDLRWVHRVRDASQTKLSAWNGSPRSHCSPAAMGAIPRIGIVTDLRWAHRVRDASQTKLSAWNGSRWSDSCAAKSATAGTALAFNLWCVERAWNGSLTNHSAMTATMRTKIVVDHRCVELCCKMCCSVNEDCSCSARPLLDLLVPSHALPPPRIVPVIAADDPGEDDGRSSRIYTVGDIPSAIAWLIIESIELSPNIDFQRRALASIQKIAPTEDIWAGAPRSHYHTVMDRRLELELGDSPQGMFIHVCIFIHLTVTLEVLDYSKPVNDDADYDGDYGEELDTGYKSIELAAQDGPCEGPVTPANARAEMIDTTKPIITDMITDEAQRSFAAPLPTLVETLRKSIPAQPAASSSTPKKALSSSTKEPKQKTKDPKPKLNSKPPHTVKGSNSNSTANPTGNRGS